MVSATLRSFRRLLPALLLAAPIVLQGVCIWYFGVNVPVSDEWAMVPFASQVHQGAEWLPMLFTQYHEHRYIMLRLAIAADVWLTGWNTVAMMYASLAISTITLLGLWNIYRRAFGPHLWAFVPIAWLHCCLVQSENLLWGMQLAYFLVLACLVWALVWLVRNTRQYLILATLAALCGTGSLANGILIWPIGLGVLWLNRARWQAQTWWLAWGICAITAYSIGYHQPKDHPLVTSSAPFRDVGQFALSVLGAPLAAEVRLAAIVLGGIVLLGCGCAIIWEIRHSIWRDKHLAGVYGLLVFGLANAALLTVGRFTQGLDMALTSRFTTLTIPAIIGLLMLGNYYLASSRHAPVFTALLLSLVMLGTLISTTVGWKHAAFWARQNRKLAFISWTSTMQHDDQFAADRSPQQGYLPSRSRIALLREQRLNLFRDPVDWWLLVRWQEGTALQEILPGQPIIQQFSCPVQGLRDIAVVFATYQRTNNSGMLQLQLSDMASDTVLATRTLNASIIGDNSWVFVRLARPLTNCTGKTLRLTISSPDAHAGTAVTAWSYPTYYNGVLNQGAAVIPGHSLGMEFNTQVYDIEEGQ